MSSMFSSLTANVARILLTALTLITLLVLSSAKQTSRTAPYSSTPIFRHHNTSVPLAQGWLGADAAYTVPLSANTTLWLFDDTLTANTLTHPTRADYHFIHNTIAIQHCHNTKRLEDCSITYHWSDDGNRTEEFWLTGRERDVEPEFYWVLDAFINWAYDKRLYVFLQRTKNVPWGLNFEGQQQNSSCARLECSFYAVDSDSRRIMLRATDVYVCSCVRVSLCATEIGGEVVSVDNWQDEPSKWRKQYQINHKQSEAWQRTHSTASTTSHLTPLQETSRHSRHYSPLSSLCRVANVSIVGQTAIANQGPDGNPFPTDSSGDQYLYSHAYLTPLQGGRSTNALMRFPLSQMHNMSQSTGLWQYYTTSQLWRNWTTDPSIVLKDAVSYWDGTQIGTVRYNTHYKQWLNVSPSPQSFIGGGAVWSGSRESLVAGWTPLSALYQMPETNHSSSSYNDEAWCYTTLEHVEFSEVAGELTFTYVCNGHTLDAVVRNNSLYTPQLVRMPYPTVVVNKTVATNKPTTADPAMRQTRRDRTVASL